MKPDGFLSGHRRRLARRAPDHQPRLERLVPSFPTPDVHLQGPDFDAILQRFQSLDFSSIAQALQLIINFVKELAHPTTPNAISDVLNTKLPLINKSLSQLLDIASDITDKIQAAITSPSDAIQQLNNILANAFGMPTPSVAVTENQHGTGGTPEKILIVVDAINGSFRLTFPPNRGPPVTTDSISYNPATPRPTRRRSRPH